MRGGIDRALVRDAVAILNRVQRYKKYLEYANFLPFYLHNSKKSSTFAPAKVCRNNKDIGARRCTR